MLGSKVMGLQDCPRGVILLHRGEERTVWSQVEGVRRGEVKGAGADRGSHQLQRVASTAKGVFVWWRLGEGVAS